MSEIPLKVLIADDEAPARNRLRELLAEIPDVVVTDEARNGREALSKAAEAPPDVMLLDIRMPGIDGIETAEHAQKLACPPAVIFTTAYDQHAMQAFEMNAIDYILKPYSRERFRQAVQKAVEKLKSGVNRQAEASAILNKMEENPEMLHRIAVK